jgi:hypothetical protein
MMIVLNAYLTQLSEFQGCGPKSDDLPSAVRWLLSELERASSAEPASPKDERARYIYIQVALSKFVRKVGGTLEQIRHGLVSPLVGSRLPARISRTAL